MSKRSKVSDILRAIVSDAMGLPGSTVADSWSCTFDRNRVHVSGPGPSFTVRDKEGFFTITYEYAPGKTTTRHYDYETTVRFLRKLLYRPPVNPD